MTSLPSISLKGSDNGRVTVVPPGPQLRLAYDELELTEEESEAEPNPPQRRDQPPDVEGEAPEEQDMALEPDDLGCSGQHSHSGADATGSKGDSD